MHQPSPRSAQGLSLSLIGCALLLAALTTACAGSDDDGHGDHDHGGEETGDPLADYCSCMLNRCHDVYHSTWGADHLESEAACLEAAGAVPLADAEVTSGNYLECRQHFCSAAELSDDGGDDPDNCPQAIGEHTCI